MPLCSYVAMPPIRGINEKDSADPAIRRELRARATAPHHLRRPDGHPARRRAAAVARRRVDRVRRLVDRSARQHAQERDLSRPRRRRRVEEDHRRREAGRGTGVVARRQIDRLRLQSRRRREAGLPLRRRHRRVAQGLESPGRRRQREVAPRRIGSRRRLRYLSRLRR